MSFKCGIVGLPNVGKSTLFNALTNSSKAQAANFPFCTIDPNVGVVPVPDERLNNLSKVSKSKKIMLSFKDISKIKATSGSDVYSTNTIVADNLELSTTSGSDMELDINTQVVDCSSTSGSDLRLSGITATERETNTQDSGRPPY